MSRHPDYFYNQAAALPIVESEGQIKIVLVSTIKGNWTLPKGVIDPGDSPQEAAIREAWEEAGIEGEMDSHEFARFQQKKWEGTCTIRVYRMYVNSILDSWPEQDTRERKIVSLNEAHQLIVKRQRPVIELLSAVITQSSD